MRVEEGAMEAGVAAMRVGATAAEEANAAVLHHLQSLIQVKSWKNLQFFFILVLVIELWMKIRA